MPQDELQGSPLNLPPADAQSLGHVLDALRPDAVRYCLKLTGNAHDAEELSQEAFLRVLTAYPDVREIERLRALLFGTMKNLRISMQRHHQQHLKYIDQAKHSPAAVEDVHPDRELSAAIERAFDALPPNQRLALHLRSKEGLGYNEIARAMGASLDEIKIWIHRGRKQVQQRIAPLMEAER